VFLVLAVKAVAAVAENGVAVQAAEGERIWSSLGKPEHSSSIMAHPQCQHLCKQYRAPDFQKLSAAAAAFGSVSCELHIRYCAC
jgi:hypothetical protein